MQIQVKPATEADIDTIRQIAWKGWYPYYLQIISEEQIRFMYATSYSVESLQLQMQQGHTFLLLYADRKPAVMASFSPYGEDGVVWKLHKLYSDPAFQGKGLGKAMLDSVCEMVKQLSGRQLQLNVNRSNPTYQFYLKYGFKVLWQEDIPFGPYWMNDYRMGNELYTTKQ